MNPDYVRVRLRERLAWYDRRAIGCKRLHFVFEYLAAIGSIVVLLALSEEEVPRWLVACGAAAVSAAIAIGKIGRFGDRWRLYRITAESVQREEQLFANRAGPYAAAPDVSERLLVERVEAILGGEASEWHALIAIPHKEKDTPLGGG